MNTPPGQTPDPQSSPTYIVEPKIDLLIQEYDLDLIQNLEQEDWDRRDFIGY